MAHVVGFVSLASVDKSSSYSKHALMAVVYQLVLVHCGMTTVASSVVGTKRRKTESKCCTGGTRNQLGSTGTADRSRSVSPARISATHICTGRKHGSAEENAARQVGDHTQYCASWTAE